MIKPVRSALLICAALVATNIAPAQAGPSAESLVTTASVSLPDVSIPGLIDPDGQPRLADPEADSDLKKIEVPTLAKPEAAEDEPTVDANADLPDLVASLQSSEAGSEQLNCLATGIYFESKSEPLKGQLAVGQVIANRSASGRFPGSYCGVLFQRGQFSFVRGKSLPSVPKSSRQWKTAVAMAKIVDQKLKQSSVGKALFFHARRVSPNWRLKRVAMIGNHIFYR